MQHMVRTIQNAGKRVAKFWFNTLCLYKDD